MKTYKNYNQISIGVIVFAVAVFGIILISLPKNASAYYVKGYYTVVDESTTTTDGNNQGGSAYDENATPVLTRISPSTINQYTKKDLHVYGDNFTPSSIVKINGENKPTTFVSRNHLVAHLSSNDTARLGDHLVSVYNPKTGAQSSSRVLKIVKSTTATTAKSGTVKKATLVRATNTTTVGPDQMIIIADRDTEVYFLDENAYVDEGDSRATLTANSFFATGGFMPNTFLQWIILFILVLLCVYLWRKITVTEQEKNKPLKHP